MDEDDPTVIDYPTPVIVGPPTGDPTGPLNAAVAGSAAQIVGFMGDDSRFKTVGWDEKVLAALAEPGFCWGWEGHQKPWPSTVFITRSITEALGWMVPPALRRGFFDVVWCVLAEMSGTARILSDVVIPHDNSKGVVDPTIIAADEAVYRQWYANDAKRDAQKIRHAIYLKA